jgi:hypothetical protein
MTTYSGYNIDSEDSFITDRIRENLQHKEQMESELVSENGMHIFYRDVLVSLAGDIVSRELIQTKYGSAFLVDGKWINPHVRPTTLEKKGYRFGLEQYSAPAIVRGYTNGTGMYGVYACSGYEYVQTGNQCDETSIKIELH